jgi:hypothetical protein
MDDLMEGRLRTLRVVDPRAGSRSLVEVLQRTA